MEEVQIVCSCGVIDEDFKGCEGGRDGDVQGRYRLAGLPFLRTPTHRGSNEMQQNCAYATAFMSV